MVFFSFPRGSWRFFFFFYILSSVFFSSAQKENIKYVGFRGSVNDDDCGIYRFLLLCVDNGVWFLLRVE